MPARSSVPKKSDITARDRHELDPLDQFVKSWVFMGILFFSLGVLLTTFVERLCGESGDAEECYGTSFSEKLDAFWWAWKNGRVLGPFP